MASAPAALCPCFLPSPALAEAQGTLTDHEPPRSSPGVPGCAWPLRSSQQRLVPSAQNPPPTATNTSKNGLSKKNTQWQTNSTFHKSLRPKTDLSLSVFAHNSQVLHLARATRQASRSSGEKQFSRTGDLRQPSCGTRWNETRHPNTSEFCELEKSTRRKGRTLKGKRESGRQLWWDCPLKAHLCRDHCSCEPSHNERHRGAKPSLTDVDY